MAMSSALLLVASCVSLGLADLLALAAANENRLADLYNSRDFSRLAQSMYTDSAVVIPPTSDAFIPKSALAGLFESLYHEQGLRNLVLTPTSVFGSSDNTAIHEIGMASSSDASPNCPYYVRWVKEDDAWKIETDIISLRTPPSSALLAADEKLPAVANLRARDGVDSGIVAETDAHFGELYNSEAFQAVQSLYADSAVLVPPDAGSFIPQAGLADFFAVAYTQAGIRNLTLTPTLTQATADGSTIHELGVVSSTSANGPYYVRWAKQADGNWKIDTDIMSIGTPDDATLLASNSAALALPDSTPALVVLCFALVGLTVGLAAVRTTRQRATILSEYLQHGCYATDPAADSYCSLQA